MPKFVKETIIVLLVILASMLLFAVLLYDFIPNRIQTKETVSYTASESVRSMLQDSVAKETENIILTYEVTGTDLTNYEKAKEYVPGKQNPFEVYTAPVKEEEEEKVENSTTTTKTSNSKSKSSSNSVAGEDTNTSTSYFKKTGTK